MSIYDQFPFDTSVEVSKYEVHVSEKDLQDFKTLLRCSKLGPKTYENTRVDGKFGVTYEWMSSTKEYWESTFDWRSVESRINSFPNYIAQVKDDDGSIHQIHLIALFSQKKDAIPAMCIHGWPGSFAEFLDLLSALQNKYKPSELPYHVIIPSLPGYAFSSAPPLGKNWRLEDSARLLHKLMVGLGFEGGYALQGGDIGSYTARIMASSYESCKALHLNFCVIPCPDETVHGELAIEDTEKRALKRGDHFVKTGTAYAIEHTTRPATIAFTLSSSPLAVLAWIGEKFLTWTDKTPSLDKILESLTLYWLTETFPTSIYSYRQEIAEDRPGDQTEDDYRKVYSQGPNRYLFHNDPKYYCRKPMGFSWFPREIAPVPVSWAGTTGNLVWSRRHDEVRGHFAALEQPEDLLEDIEDFLKQVMK